MGCRPEGLKVTADWLHPQRRAFAAYIEDQLDAQGRSRRDYVLSALDSQPF